jgi:hypothetical protein
MAVPVDLAAVAETLREASTRLREAAPEHEGDDLELLAEEVDDIRSRVQLASQRETGHERK